MWFKNIQVYECVEPISKSQQELEEFLQDKAFKPCGRSMPSSIGWVPPAGKGSEILAYQVQGFVLFSLKIEEKIIPTSVIAEQLEERITEIEEREHRGVARREKLRMKDEIYDDLVPKALSRSSRINGLIDTQENWLMVDTSSAAKADLFVSELRKSLGRLKVQIPETMSPSVLLTHWLKTQSAPAPFSLGDQCVLTHTGKESSVVRCQHHDLGGDAIQEFLQEGYAVSQLGLNWHDELKFTLKEDLTVTRLKFSQVFEDKISEIATEDDAERFDVNFVMMAESYRAFMIELMEAFKKEPKITESITAAQPEVAEAY